MDYHYLLLLISIAGYRLGTETTHSHPIRANTSCKQLCLCVASDAPSSNSINVRELGGGGTTLSL
jgi:hypothetical protein